MLNNPTFFLDLVTASWMVIISSFLFIFLPSGLLNSGPSRRWSSRAASGFVRMLTLITIGSLLWIMLGLLNWFTAFLTLLVSGAMVWFLSLQRHHQKHVQQLGQDFLTFIIQMVERGITRHHLQQLGTHWQRQLKKQLNSPSVIIASIAILIITLFTVWLRFSYPLSELRFSQPSSYGQLLTVQQILGREYLKLDYLPVFPALIAFMSLLSGVDAIHTQHFGSAIIGCWLVLAVGYGTWRLTRSLPASAVVGLSLGVYLFTGSEQVPAFVPERIQLWFSAMMTSLNQGLMRQWNPNEAEIGALCLVLGVAATSQIIKRPRQNDGWIDTLCCVLMLMMTAPPLLLLLLAGGLGVIFGPRVALFAMSLSWVSVACLAAFPQQQLPIDRIFLTTLPVGLSLLLGLAFLVVAEGLKGLLHIWSESLCLIVVMAIAVNFWLPSGQVPNYLEYDAAARKTVEIGNFFAYKSWTIVAPIEQLSQSYHQGWYEDLAKFVTTYRGQVANPNFFWPLQTPDIFILVEKKPFGADQPEPLVPYSVSHDPVYRNYRSASGRARLQAAALQMCETYRQNHPDSKIYYEDQVIKIYQFSGQRPPKIQEK